MEKTYAIENSKANHCPICNSEKLIYGTLEVLDDCVKYPWECPDCRSTGAEYAKLVFDGHIVEVDEAESTVPVQKLFIIQLSGNQPWLEDTAFSYVDVLQQLAEGRATITTPLTHFCKYEILERGYDIALAFPDNTFVGITKGGRTPAGREIRPELNLERLLLAGEFGPIC